MSGLRNEQFEDLCANVVNKITNIAEKSCEKMEELRVQLKAEEEKLKCENSLKIKMKFEEDDSKNYSSLMENQLRPSKILSEEDLVVKKEFCNANENDQHESKHELDKCQEMYKTRYERFQSYKKIVKSQEYEQGLCITLGIPSKYEKFEILSPKRMEQCRKDLQKLYSLKKKRQQHYHEIISEIKSLLSDMEIFTWSEFEKNALNEDEFTVTKENLNALHEWKLRLIQQSEQEQKIIEDLKNKVTDLWDKLEVDLKFRQEFLIKTFTYQNRKSISSELQKELHQCSKLWRQKIRRDVNNMRKEIIDLWVKCHVGQEQRDRFIAFNSDTFNEELLNLHKQEINRLKQLYRENAELTDLAIKWSELRGKLKNLECGHQNISRFNNRGGNLLKEEKERKKYQRSISVTESKIMHLAIKYKTDRGCHFYFNGRPILQLIDESRIRPKKGKENQTKRDTSIVKKKNLTLKFRDSEVSLKNNNLKSLYKPKLSNINNHNRSTLRI